MINKKIIYLVFLMISIQIRGEVLFQRNFSLLIMDKKVGWVEKKLVQKENDSEKWLECIEKTYMNVERFGSQVFVRQTSVMRETLQGKPLGFKVIRNENGKFTTTSGEMKEKNVLEVREKSGKNETVKNINIPEGKELVLSVDYYLYILKEFYPGMKKKFLVFIPEMEMLSDCELTVKSDMKLQLGNRKFSGVGVEVNISKLGMMNIQQIIDEKGHCTAGKMGVISFFQEEKKESQKMDKDRNILKDFEIHCDIKKANSESFFSEITVKNLSGKIGDYFIPYENCEVEKKNGSIILKIQKRFQYRDSELVETLKNDSKFIEFDGKMQNFAINYISDCKTTLSKVKKLNKWVYENTEKTAEVLFASAKEVFEERRGDCTEHSVLLCSLLRSVGIDSRCVIGAVIQKNKLIYHMWTEFKLNDLWIPVDSALNQFPIDVYHLKMGNCDGDLREKFYFHSSSLMSVGPSLEIKGKTWK